MVNRIVLVGRLTADPEERHTNSGVMLGKFRIAVNRNRRGPDGEEQTDFFNVVCFRHTAEYVNRYLGRGDLVAVDGRCQIDQYTDRDGNPRTWVEVAADSVQSLARADASRGGGGGGGGAGRRDDFDDEGDGDRWEHAEDAASDEPAGEQRPARRAARGRPEAGRDEGDRAPSSGRKSQQFSEPEGGAFTDDNDDPFAEE